MVISKKKLVTISSLILAIFIFAFLATPCYRYTSSITGGTYYLGYDFGFGGNIIVESFNATLVSVLGCLALFNLVSLFVNKIDEKVTSITNISLWVIITAFSVCCLCVKYVNVSYNPTNSMIFVLVIALIGIASSIYLLVKQEDKD